MKIPGCTWLLLAPLVLAPAAFARQDEGGERDTKKEVKEAKDAREPKKKDDIKSYDSVITADAITRKGLFLTHRVDDKLYYEIPRDAFGKEMLWVTQVAKTGAGHGYGGTSAGDRVVRWELDDKRVLLRDVKFELRADVDDPIASAVGNSSSEPIIRVLPVKAWGKDQAAVIDVTELFKADVAEFSAKRALGASSMDKERTFIQEVKAFPTNIETKVLATYQLGGGRGRGPIEAPPGPSGGDDGDRGAVTALIHHSMVALPAEPMKPRRYDSRVGFFTVGFEDYGDQSDHQVEEVQYINRWRLEKKDPAAAVSEPVKPIIFYVGREVPDTWRPWVKKGIEAWQPAFEAAGFKNAIVAVDAPSERDDPDWDAEDARYSSIRWLPSTVENAMGPHVHDPRTGEILESDILMFHNVLKLCRDWYFVQASPMDPRAQKLPLPDDLVGELLAYVVTHEVGHTLGFPHNMKASSAFTVEQLRDKEFTEKYGTEASIMDYGRYNYVAQPGDGARLIPKVGPYDFFAVEWGYRPFPEAKTWAEEKQQLDAIAARQVDDPTLRFGDPNAAVDPTQQTEDLGSDPVAATELGLKNIGRVAGYLVDATCRANEDYSLLRNMYTELLGQRDRELGHVVNVIGGTVENNVYFGAGDRVYAAVPADRQKRAVQFLCDSGFHMPAELTAAGILDRLEPNGAADRFLRSSQRILGGLIAPNRVKRMAEQAERATDGGYAPGEMLKDVRVGIWSELEQPKVDVGLFRRNLQRAHVDVLGKQVDVSDVGSDLPALARGELEAVLANIKASLGRAADRETRLHLADLAARIDKVLEPRSARGTTSPVPAEPATSSN